MDECLEKLPGTCGAMFGGSFLVKNAAWITVILFLVCVIGVLVCRCRNERRISSRIEKDLQVHELYDESFKNLLDTIRKKQHEYNNHIQAILSMHYSIHTYEELVQEQKAYCDSLVEDTRYYGLLNGKWPVLSGFLYSKFIEADKKGIHIKYAVRVERRSYKIPEFVMVEILGILVDNAMEAVEGSEYPIIYVSIEDADEFRIEIGNPVQGLTQKEMMQFFDKGYTSKEGHSGLGLCKLAEYSQRYGIDRKALQIVYEGRECFVVVLKI